jgi:hypothetical protein
MPEHDTDVAALRGGTMTTAKPFMIKSVPPDVAVRFAETARLHGITQADLLARLLDLHDAAGRAALVKSGLTMRR